MNLYPDHYRDSASNGYPLSGWMGAGGTTAFSIRPVKVGPAPKAEELLPHAIMVGVGLLRGHGHTAGLAELLDELQSAGGERDGVRVLLVLVDGVGRSLRWPEASSAVEHERQLLRQAAEKRGLVDQIVFVDGPLTPETLAGLLNRADVFVSRSRADDHSTSKGLTFALAEGPATVSTHVRIADEWARRDPAEVAGVLGSLLNRVRKDKPVRKRRRVGGDDAQAIRGFLASPDSGRLVS